jgi:hypothetical protein
MLCTLAFCYTSTESNLIEVKVSGLIERGSSEYFVVIHYSTLFNNCDSKSG